MYDNEVYRVKNGQILSDRETIPFNFGIIFNHNGLLKIELYVDEIFNLSAFSDGKDSKYWNKEYNIDCITEERNELELDRLMFTSINYNLSKIEMVCYGKMTHKIVKEKSHKHTDDNSKIHYLELEGLKMEFCDVTEEIRARRGKEINNFNNYKRDHTSALLVSEEHQYHQVFYKADNSENIIVEFPDGSNHKLSLKKYQEIKLEYVAILSFLNGATVRVRKEFTGSYYTMGKVDSEVVITYSFQKINNSRYNRYIPLNNRFRRSENVINKFMMFNFDKYCDWNRKIDLNSIIFYLNNSEQSKSMEEKVFIQMIAFERITTKYAEYLGEKEEFLPNRDDFQQIRQELIDVIDKYKGDFGNAYSTVKSKICNLNQIKRLSTTDKMYRIINDCNINITESIEKLIDVVRHKTIHEGGDRIRK